MSVWTTPVSFVSGATLTAADLNSEIRDHLNFLRGALDVLTAGTTADTGTTMLLDVPGSATTSATIATRVSGDAFHRFEVRADGQFHWLTSTTGDVEQLLDPNPTQRRLTLKGLASGVAANNQLAIELAATPGGNNAFFIWANGDTQPRLSLGTNSASEPVIAFGPGGGTAADVSIYRLAAATLAITGDITVAGEIAATGTLTAGNSVIAGTKPTGWGIPTGTATRTTFATSTVTTEQLAQRVKAMVEDLQTVHALLGA